MVKIVTMLRMNILKILKIISLMSLSKKLEDAGHFLHVEKANEFYEISSNFFKN